MCQSQVKRTMEGPQKPRITGVALMIRLAHWSFRHRRMGVAGWLIAAVVVVGRSSSSGSKFNPNFNLPRTDSQTAVNLLTKSFPAASGEGDQVVLQATHGSTIRSPSVKAAAT